MRSTNDWRRLKAPTRTTGVSGSLMVIELARAAQGPLIVPTPTIQKVDIDAVVAGRHPRPFDVLGPHPRHAVSGPTEWLVRVFLPWASEVALLRRGRLEPLVRVHAEGLFEGNLPKLVRAPTYRLRVTAKDGRTFELDDPYRLPPVLRAEALRRFTRGEHHRAYELLGAHVMKHRRLDGTCFAVWAPHAVSVNVMGSFNGWIGRCHPMRSRGESGVWELFVPGVGHGAYYKYEIQTRTRGRSADKADPYGFAMEVRPNTASIVYDLSSYAWQDRGWLRERRRHQAPTAPISIYEVHLGSWRQADAEGAPGELGPGEELERTKRWLTYRELADELVPYVKDLGYTHLELLPVTEYPFDGSWGYQSVGYFAPTARYGSPDDLRYFIDCAHQAGLGVILDWVPAHFPRDAHGLGFFDGTHLYEHADPRRGAHPDWGTFVYDYGRPEVSSFLISSALFWLEEYHIDGLRVDAVASMLYLDYSREPGQWLPNRYGGKENLEAVGFLRRLNDAIHEAEPTVLMFAEESTTWPRVSRPTSEGGLGFDLKWNMGWMNDTLRYARTDPLFRKGLHDTLTFSIHYGFTENFLLPLSHDEVVHGKGSLLAKMPGEPPQKLATLRAILGYMYAHPGKKLLFMGNEIGVWREWNHDGELEWDLLRHAPHRGLQTFVRDLNQTYRREAALHELDFDWQGFDWIDRLDNQRSVISFVRWTRKRRQFIVAVASFTPVVWEDYELPVPRPGEYELIINSDATRYDGQGAEVAAAPLVARRRRVPVGELTHALRLTLPPLSMLYLKRRPKKRRQT